MNSDTVQEKVTNEKGCTFCDNQQSSSIHTNLSKKCADTVKLSPELSKTNHSEIKSTNNIVLKRKTGISRNDNKRRSCDKFAPKKHKDSRIQKLSFESTTDALENSLTISTNKDNNFGLSALENMSDSFECVPPTQIQKNVLENPAFDSSECISPTQMQSNFLKSSTPLIFGNFNKFDNVQNKSGVTLNEDVYNLIRTSKNTVKGNSDKNSSQSIHKESRLELDNANLDASGQKDASEIFDNALLLHIQKDSKILNGKSSYKDACNINQTLTQFNSTENDATKFTKRFENQLGLFGSKKLPLPETQTPSETFPPNDLPYNDLLISNEKNSDNFDTSTQDKNKVLQEFSIDTSDGHLLCSVLDEFQNNSNPFTCDILKGTFINNFIESSCGCNEIACCNQHVKTPLLCKDNNNPFSLKSKRSPVNPTENNVNKNNQHFINSICDLQMPQSVPTASCNSTLCDKNCFMDINCSASILQPNSLCSDTLSNKSFRNVDCSTSIPETESPQLNISSTKNFENSNSTISNLQENNLITELTEREELSNFVGEITSNSSSQSLDQQLIQMGFEMLPEPKTNLTQSLNPENNCTSEKKHHLKSSIPTMSKNSEKILFLFDVEKKSYEICVLPESSLCNVQYKPTTTHSESQTDTNINDTNQILNSETKTINETKKGVNDCISENFITVDGIKLPIASLFPVVNLGKRCDDPENRSNKTKKHDTYSYKNSQQNDDFIKSSRLRKRKRR